MKVDRKLLAATTKASRGEGEETKLGVQFFYMDGAEINGVVSADSPLAREILDRLQSEGIDGIITLPAAFKDFTTGKLSHALGALTFSL